MYKTNRLKPTLARGTYFYTIEDLNFIFGGKVKIDKDGIYVNRSN